MDIFFNFYQLTNLHARLDHNECNPIFKTSIISLPKIHPTKQLKLQSSNFKNPLILVEPNKAFKTFRYI
jgi:hypothetical protein